LKKMRGEKREPDFSPLSTTAGKKVVKWAKGNKEQRMKPTAKNSTNHFGETKTGPGRRSSKKKRNQGA